MDKGLSTASETSIPKKGCYENEKGGGGGREGKE